MENGRIDMIMRAFVADLKLKVIPCGIQAFIQLHALDCEEHCNSKPRVSRLGGSISVCDIAYGVLVCYD